MCGSATFAMEVSITSINVAMVTVKATAQGLCPGCQPSCWALSAIVESVLVNQPSLGARPTYPAEAVPIRFGLSESGYAQGAVERFSRSYQWRSPAAED